MEDHNHEELSAEELLQVTEDKVDALINVLLAKGIISEDDLQSALEDLYEDEPSED